MCLPADFHQPLENHVTCCNHVIWPSHDLMTSNGPIVIFGGITNNRNINFPLSASSVICIKKFRHCWPPPQRRPKVKMSQIGPYKECGDDLDYLGRSGGKSLRQVNIVSECYKPSQRQVPRFILLCNSDLPQWRSKNAEKLRTSREEYWNKQ